MIFTLIDFYICYSIISFKRTILYIIVYGLLYIVWSIIYQIIADEAIYPVMDWKEQPIGAIIVAAMVLILAIIIHLFLCWSKNKLLSKRGYNDVISRCDVALAETMTPAPDKTNSLSTATKESYGGVEQQTGNTDVVIVTTDK